MVDMLDCSDRIVYIFVDRHCSKDGMGFYR